MVGYKERAYIKKLKTSNPTVSCKRISSGKYFVKIGKHEYEIYNHGYHAPDKCVWWQAVNLKTNEADFHEHTKSNLLKTMVRELLSNVA